MVIEGLKNTPETIKGTGLCPGREAQEGKIDVKHTWCVVWEELLALALLCSSS